MWQPTLIWFKYLSRPSRPRLFLMPGNQWEATQLEEEGLLAIRAALGMLPQGRWLPPPRRE